MAYHDVVLSQAPTHLWRCTEASGPLADSGSSPIAATTSNLTYGAAGPTGADPALAWDGVGTPEQVVVAGNSSLPDGTTAAFTLSLWANPTNHINYYALATRHSSGANGWTWALEQTSGKAYWGASTAKAVFATTAPASAAWSHLAVVVTLAAGTYSVTHYLNGAANGTGTFAKGSDFTAPSTTSLYWGIRGTDGAFPLRGALADPAIWTGTALSAAQILAQYTMVGPGYRGSRAYVTG